MVGNELAARVANDTVVVHSRLRRRLLDVAAAEGVSPTQRSVLSRLSKTGPATTSELASAERVRQQSMAVTVQLLEEAGMVERSDHPSDGRCRIVALTHAGRSFVDGQRHAHKEWLAQALAASCTGKELQIVQAAMAVLDRVIDT